MNYLISRRVFAFGLFATSSLVALPSIALADDGAEAYVKKLGVELIKLANGGRRGDKALQNRFAALLGRFLVCVCLLEK